MDYIIRIPMGKSNSYLIKGNKGFILIDAGTQNKKENIKLALKRIKANLSDINLIIITHVHYDHVGSLYQIKKESNASVLVHTSEQVDLANGFTYFPKGTQPFSKAISNIANKFFISEKQFQPIKADIIIDDSFKLNTYGIEGEVIHTPGHTRGSICIILEGKYCFTGDTMFNLLPGSVYPPFANNKELLIESWKKISNYNCLKYYPGHGKEFDKEKFRISLAKRT